MKSIFLCEDLNCPLGVYSEETIKLLEKEAELSRTVYNKEYLKNNKEKFAHTEYIFSTWSMTQLSEDEIREYLPSLKAVFYAAGTVQYFARPFLNCGIGVYSAWAANAVPGAEYTVAQIVLANKGFYRASAVMKAGNPTAARDISKGYIGNFGANIGIIGAGMIGKLVIEMLKAYKLNVLVFDPFLPQEKAEELGVKKCGLEELFESCQVVSNHLANNEQTKGMLNGALFEKLPQNATFLNTGRGAQVVESELAEVLEARPDVVAILDVTEPEPPLENSPFYTLPNCILTPHIAGSSGKEVNRMAEYAAEEFLRYKNGEETRYGVTLKMLETMA